MNNQELKVLFVDDEPNILNAFKRQLRGKIDLTIATGGLKGIEAIKTTKEFAVVISDMTMPGMNGVEFLEKVKKN